MELPHAVAAPTYASAKSDYRTRHSSRYKPTWQYKMANTQRSALFLASLTIYGLVYIGHCPSNRNSTILEIGCNTTIYLATINLT